MEPFEQGAQNKPFRQDHNGKGEQRDLTPILSVVYPRDLRQHVNLGAIPCTLGSSRNADIVLNDDSVAAIHCRVSICDDGVIVEDLGSATGTWVDNERVDFATLNTGHVLRIGRFKLMLSYHSDTGIEFNSRIHLKPGTDRLAGIPNRAWILQRAEALIAARAGSGYLLSAAMLAIDRMPVIHRRFGVHGCDQTLRKVAQLVRSRAAPRDLIGLFGAEKFFMLFPDLPREDTQSKCEMLRDFVRGQRLDIEGDALRITVSLGCATRCGREIRSAEQLLACADHALHRAREQGGDRVVALLPGDAV